LHVVLLLNDSVAKGWTDEEVVRRWGRLFPPRGKDRQALEVTDVWVELQLKNVKWVEETRSRLNSLGLVHEVSEGTGGSDGEPGRQLQGHVFRESLQEYCNSG